MMIVSFSVSFYERNYFLENSLEYLEEIPHHFFFPIPIPLLTPLTDPLTRYKRSFSMWWGWPHVITS